jgi:hypothetical protein
MTYFSNHLAWQQRVSKEFKEATRYASLPNSLVMTASMIELAAQRSTGIPTWLTSKYRIDHLSSMMNKTDSI